MGCVNLLSLAENWLRTIWNWGVTRNFNVATRVLLLSVAVWLQLSFDPRVAPHAILLILNMWDRQMTV